MRATVMYAAGDVQVKDVPDPVLREPTDVLVRVVRASICGNGVWPYASMSRSEQGRRMGHEFPGVVGETGADVAGVTAGDPVIAPFLWADNTGQFCREGPQSAVTVVGGGTVGLLAVLAAQRFGAKRIR
ncbi:alcohol dehydrogenase catalytic domain-containing protein [Amycolatopsis cynarae]|uniref:alcohol dehydrogenase catalytic domain-containing protein n=1 Tax=Amycolatopsis cynarae TaxID=2995223 RepID=UPI003899601C